VIVKTPQTLTLVLLLLLLHIVFEPLEKSKGVSKIIIIIINMYVCCAVTMLTTTVVVHLADVIVAGHRCHTDADISATESVYILFVLLVFVVVAAVVF